MSPSICLAGSISVWSAAEPHIQDTHLLVIAAGRSGCQPLDAGSVSHIADKARAGGCAYGLGSQLLSGSSACSVACLTAQLMARRQTAARTCVCVAGNEQHTLARGQQLPTEFKANTSVCACSAQACERVFTSSQAAQQRLHL